MNRIRSLLCILFLVSITDTSSSDAGESCATSFLSCGGSTQTITAPSGALDCGGGVITNFDLVAGTIRTNAPSGWSARVEAVDDYVVTGPPAGTPLVLNLKVTASIGAGRGYDYSVGFAEVIVREASAGQVRMATLGEDIQNRTLELPLSVFAGQSFRVTFIASSVADRGDAQADVHEIRFDGLPPGSLVRSCHGFQQDVPVPTTRASWGGLKQRYR